MSLTLRFHRSDAPRSTPCRGGSHSGVGRPGRRVRITVSALVLGALVLGAGASASQAAVGSVYFDANDNAAAGETNLLFNATFTGTSNVGLGRSVMPNLTDGTSNVALGTQALDRTTTGDNNVAAGQSALFFNTSGDFNVATGGSALLSNNTGTSNVATGFGALNANITGDNNLAAGFGALASNTIGSANVAVGRDAVAENMTGDANVGVGRRALLNASGSRNLALGQNAGTDLTTGSDNVAIANKGAAGDSGTIRIGARDTHTATFIAGIRDTTLGDAGQPVLISSKGRLGTAPAGSPTTTSLAATVERLSAQLPRPQRQIDRLRDRVKGG